MRTRRKVLIGALLLGAVYVLAVLASFQRELISGQVGDFPTPNVSRPTGVAQGGVPTAKPSPQVEQPTTTLLDRVLQNMQFGTIVFNTPESMELHQTQVIHLVLGVTQPNEELRSLIVEEGPIEQHQIRIAAHMEAHLSGRGFEITAITPTRQPISTIEPTEWKWDVTATQPGQRRLHLVLNAIIDVDGSEHTRSIRTFAKTIVVQVSWPTRALTFVTTNWQWIWTAILVPLVPWLIARVRKRNQQQRQRDLQNRRRRSGRR